jgi:hypothetical protein
MRAPSAASAGSGIADLGSGTTTEKHVRAAIDIAPHDRDGRASQPRTETLGQVGWQGQCCVEVAQQATAL